MREGLGNRIVDPWAQLGIAVCAVLVIIGALGPWAGIPGSDIDGSAKGDGAVTIALAAIAGAVAIAHVYRPHPWWWSSSALVLMVIVAILGIINWINVEDLVSADERDEAKVAWGLMLLTIASLAGASIAFVTLIVHRLSPDPVSTDEADRGNERV